MAVIPLQSQRRVSIAPAEPNLIQPSRQVVDPVAGAVAGVADNFSKLTDKLAREEEKQVELLQKNQIAADVSNLEIERLSRVAELQMNGTGDKPFVQGVMEDFDARIKEVEAGYSPFMLQEFRQKVLPLKQTVAKTALATNMALLTKQIERNTESVVNTLSTKASLGLSSYEETGLAIKAYVADLPANMQAAAEQEMRRQTQAAFLQHQSTADPDGFLRELKENPDFYINEGFDAGDLIAYRGKAVAEQERRRKALEDEQKLFATDPVAAAKSRLARDGVMTPSPQALRDAQLAAGVHPVDVAVLSKTEAQTLAKNLSVPRDLGQFILELESSKKEIEARGGDWNQVLKDVKRFGGTLHPAVLGALDYAEKPALYTPEYGAALMQLLADPDAGKKAKESIGGATETDPIESAVLGAIEDDMRIMQASGSSTEEDMARIRQAKVDAAFIMAAEKKRLGTYSRSDIVAAVTTPPGAAAKVITNRDAYYVPPEFAEKLNRQTMDDVREAWLNAGKLDVPATFPGRRLSDDDIRRNAGWVSYGDDAVQLTIRGVPVYVEGKPVIESWNSLAVEYRDLEERGLVGLTLGLGDVNSTVVVRPAGNRVNPFKRTVEKKPAVAPQGLLLPPPAKATQANPNRPRNPGELAPPTGME